MSRHVETDVLHRGEGAREGAAPLTTPIYATSTFVFANAAELEAVPAGPVGQVHLHALREPDRAGGRGEARGARGRRGRDGDLVGHGRDGHGAVRPARGR